MAEAGGLQSYYEANVDRGFMSITVLNGTETADLKDWADTYGLTHPVVGDVGDSFFWTFSQTSSWPMVVLLDHGAVITSADEGAGEAQIEELLTKYE